MRGDFEDDLREAKAILHDHVAGNPGLYRAIEIIEAELEKGSATEEDDE